MDESDGSLVQLYPSIGVITNIELDHPDHYASLEQVIEAFQRYASQSDLVIACLDCENVTQHIKVDLGYSIEDHPEAIYLARQIQYFDKGTTAQIWERDQYLGNLRLQLLGAHNLSNALAAVAVGRHLGMDFEVIAAALGQFIGAHRRFEIKGQIGDVIFVDDYAHHPSEIKATLSAARLQQRRVIALFQPHRYSRLASLFEEFSQAFDQADVVIIAPTYGAGEPNPGTSPSLSLAATIAQVHSEVYYVPELQRVAEALLPLLQPKDLVLFLGAGDLNQTIPAVIAAYAQTLPLDLRSEDALEAPASQPL